MAGLNSQTSILFCEGADDVAFLEWIMAREEIEGLQVSSLDGLHPLEKKVKVRLREIPGGVAPPADGLLLDADDVPDARREAARNALLGAAPASRHGVYLLPDDAGTGMLEDLLLAACRLPNLVACARGFVECAELAYEGTINPSKARYDAYCGVVRPTQRGVQKGVGDGELDASHPSLQRLVRFLRELSGEG